MNEIWKPVNKYEGLYEISEYGNIQRVLPNDKRRPIVTRIDWRGYKTAHLSNKKAQTIKIHKMVLEAFDRPKPDGMQVNHKDANKLNNHISNLEWVTPSENIIHSYKFGLQVDNRGENNGQSKLKPYDILRIRTENKMGNTNTKIAKMFGVSTSLISAIMLGKRWAHL